MDNDLNAPATKADIAEILRLLSAISSAQITVLATPTQTGPSDLEAGAIRTIYRLAESAALRFAALEIEAAAFKERAAILEERFVHIEKRMDSHFGMAK